jgi:hypothetical protein
MVPSTNTTPLTTIPVCPKIGVRSISAIRISSCKSARRLQETMNWGMLSYENPLETYPNTYNKKHSLHGLAAQKNYNSLYLMASIKT